MSKRSHLHDHYHRHYQWARERPDAVVLRELARARTWRRKMGPRWPFWATKIHALVGALADRGYYAKPETEHLLIEAHFHDIPAWAIPGYGIRLVERPDDARWMTWVDNAGYTIDCIVETECTSAGCHPVFAVFRLLRPGRVEFLGHHIGLAAARRASGVEPGRIIPRQELLA